MIRGFMKHRGQLVCEALAVMLLSVALDGCIAERYDTPGGVDGKLIKFTPAVVASKGTSGTRAVGGHPIESGSNIPVDGSFGTYAYSKITPISSIVSYDALQNMKVTSDGTDFTYSPVAKWPVEREAELAFYGYYPWQSQSAPPATGDPVIGIMMGAQTPSMTIAYVTPTNPSKQVDLMYAYTGMTTGYDPVEMNFGHALTRVNFKAQVKEYAQPVVITSISITDVRTRGNLIVVDENTPLWSNLSSEATISQTALNGLTGIQLTSLSAPMTASGGDMLLIPQSVQGFEVKVEATLNGTPFDDSFTFSLAGTPDWEMNKIVTYEITISGSGMTLDARVNNWNQREVTVIQDGQWWMTMNRDEFEIERRGAIVNFTFQTNYPEQVYASIPTAPVDYSGWLDIIATAGSSQSGYTSMVQVKQSTESNPRSGEVHIVAGNMTKVIKITQRGEYYPPRHSGWAGSNIYWDGSKLTFDDVNVRTHEKYQGVYFQWGSLWGLAPNGSDQTIWGTNHTVYLLNNDCTYRADVGGHVWGGIPRVGDAEAITGNPPSGKEDKDRNYLYEITDGSTGKGDICRYLTEQAGGLIHGRKWRMPTRREFEDCYNSMHSGNSNVAVSSDGAGKQSMTAGRTMDGKVFFPASGYRKEGDGLLCYVDSRGYYWTGTPNRIKDSNYIYGGNWDFWSNYEGKDSGSLRSYGYSVRCVAE